MKHITCVCCGYTSEKEVDNVNEYSDNGFEFVWDVSQGLNSVPVCKECYKNVEYHVSEIEKIIGLKIGYIRIPDFD